ncbi:MAG TPA: TVP38/TMEM64 family protein [Arenibaculum sp.]|nr:TVP38/TMEM64 family protein [Arenibaculum sp.]
MPPSPHRSEPPPPRASLRRFVPLALLAAGFVLFFALGLDEHVSLEALADNRETLRAYVEDHVLLAAGAYVAVYALAVALSIPGAVVLTLAGGFLFGTGLATVCVVAGATIGAVGVFLAARTAFAGALRRRAGPWLTRLEAGFAENAFSYLLVLRLVPLFPFWLVNLVPAFLGVPLGTFALATLIGLIPGRFVYASVGNGLGAVIDAGGEPDVSIILDPEILLPLLGLALRALRPAAYRQLRGGTLHG